MSFYGWQVLERIAQLEEDADFWAEWMDRLHPDEQRALVAGEIGVIKRPLRPEWPVGEWMEIASNLWIKPEEPKFTHRGWRIYYSMRDFRVHLVRRVPAMFEPPALDSFGTPIPPSPDAIKQARLDGSYTAAHELAVPEDDEAPYPDELGKYRLDRERKAQALQETTDLIAAAEDVMAAIRERVDASPAFKREARLTNHRIRRELDRFIERQRRKAA